VFAHALLWNCEHEKCYQPEALAELESAVIAQFTDAEAELHQAEFGLIDNLAAISERLLALPVERREPRLIEELEKVSVTPGMYVPSNPRMHILGINAAQSRCLKSHARVPIYVAFDVCDKEDSARTPIPFGCIFKIRDDVRMDTLMIQIIDKFMRIFADAGLDTFMMAYRVFATGAERGVIECIRNARSRHDLGVERREELTALFIRRYGPVWSEGFRRAQRNFVCSMAPYSLLCYLFQVKDRHNANIMIDDDGHIIHIDFGFIFDVAPGGVKFEKSSFKLTAEMVQLLGGGRDAPPFIEFARLFAQCFFAVRERYSEIEPIVFLMRNAGLPCFKAFTFKNLQQRFFLDKSDGELMSAIDAVLGDAMNWMRTYLYDQFQYNQNQIFFI
jgi:phosphatidylinositol 4-kinase